MKTTLTKIKSYLLVAAGAAVMALCYILLIYPNAFAPAGINGIATMIQYLFHFNVGYMSLIINIPLLSVAFFILNKQYTLLSFTYVAVFSVSLILLGNVDLSAFIYSTDNGTSLILAPITAGAINGCIMGLIIKHGGSTGGTDIIASFIHKSRPYLSLVWIIFGLNAAVACISYFVYGYKPEPVIMCIIYCFVSSKTSDYMVKGGKGAIKFEVISNRADEITSRLITELHHGATVIDVKGAFSGEGKKLIVCIVNKHQIVDFQNIIAEYDDTFAYISGVNETLGNYNYKIGHNRQKNS